MGWHRPTQFWECWRSRNRGGPRAIARGSRAHRLHREDVYDTHHLGSERDPCWRRRCHHRRGYDEVG